MFLLQLALHPVNGKPAPGYLIQMDDGINVLVDSGFPKEHDLPGGKGERLNERDYIVNQIAALGVAPADIRYLVCTHFDMDHAGGHDAFPDTEFVVQRIHYDVARAGTHPRFERARPHWDDSRLRYRLIDGDTTLLEGVDLIESGGHVPGHQSVLVRLPETGPVLLAIDAVAQATQFDPDTRDIGPQDMDEDQVRSSTRKLAQIARDQGVKLVVFGHDAEQWRNLRKAPHYYE